MVVCVEPASLQQPHLKKVLLNSGDKYIACLVTVSQHVQPILRLSAFNVKQQQEMVGQQ